MNAQRSCGRGVLADGEWAAVNGWCLLELDGAAGCCCECCRRGLLWLLSVGAEVLNGAAVAAAEVLMSSATVLRK